MTMQTLIYVKAANPRAAIIFETVFAGLRVIHDEQND